MNGGAQVPACIQVKCDCLDARSQAGEDERASDIFAIKQPNKGVFLFSGGDGLVAMVNERNGDGDRFALDQDRLKKMFVREILQRLLDLGREEGRLTPCGHHVEKLFDDRLLTARKQVIDILDDDKLNVLQAKRLAVHMFADARRRANDNGCGLIQLFRLPGQRSSRV